MAASPLPEDPPPTLVGALASLADDEELPQRARDLISLVLFHGAVAVERIEYQPLRRLFLAAADLRLGTGHVADVERAAEEIFCVACPDLVSAGNDTPRSGSTLT